MNNTARHSDIIDMPDWGGQNRDHDGRYHPKNDDVVIPSNLFYYIGDKNTNGSWRIGIVSGKLEVQKRVSGTWTWYGRFGPD